MHLRGIVRSAVWLAACAPLYGQVFGRLSIGVKTGLPLSESFDFAPPDSCHLLPACAVSNYSSKTKRYTFGPTIEVRLAHGFAFEFDALYNRLNYDSYFYSRSPSAGQRTTYTSTRASRWAFPALLKWKHDIARMSPFLDGGVAFDHISGAESTFTGISQDSFGFVTSLSGKTSNPSELSKRTSEGFVVGGGMELRAARSVRLMPEIRYTRWFSSHFTSALGTGFGTNQDEVTFLLGIAF
jgi:opacity protein-like surface antigen